MKSSDTAVTSDGHTFRVEPRWKEVVVYWEGEHGYVFDAGWGVEPPVLYVPSPSMSDDVGPSWMLGRRSAVVSGLKAKSGHVLTEDVHGYYRQSPESRVLRGVPWSSSHR